MSGRHRRTPSEAAEVRHRRKDGAFALYLLAAIGCALIGYLVGTASMHGKQGGTMQEFFSEASNFWSDDAAEAQRGNEEANSASSMDTEEEKEHDGSGVDFEEAFSLTDLRTIVGIVFTLILLTVAFEQAKEYLEESIEEDMEIILEKLFGELTILGFLSMVTFMVSKTGLFEQLSEKIFEEENELLEYFEFVHFALFFLMVFFVIQVLTMIREAGHQQKEWDKIEESIRHQRTHNPTQAEQDQVYDLQRRPWYTLFCTRLWSNQRAVVAREEAVYRALRREFILDRALDPPFEVRGPEKRIQDTFNFARYLGLAQIHILSHAVEVQKGTWMFFAFSSIVFYYIAVLVEEKIESLGWVWVAIGWAVFLGNFIFVAHMRQLRNSFLPNTGISRADENDGLLESNGGTQDENLPLWCTLDFEKFLRKRPLLAKWFVGGVPNRQQAHFWMDRQGPKFYIFLLQVDLIFVGGYAGLLLLEFIPFAYHKQPASLFVLFVILGMTPAIGILYNKRDLVAFMAQSSSIGTYRKDQIVRDVLLEETTSRIVRTFIIIHRMRRVAERGLPMVDDMPIHVTFENQETFSNLEREEVGRSFKAFDSDNSDSITKDEFRALMSRLGANVNEEHFDRLVNSLDTDGDGVVTKDEFINWYLYYANKDKISLKERAEDLFVMFDTNGSGEITLGEFKNKLEALNMDFTMDEIGAILHELDHDRSGSVSLEEFEMLLEKYFPEELRGRGHHHRH